VLADVRRVPEAEGVGFGGEDDARQGPSLSTSATRSLEQGRLIGQKRSLKPKDARIAYLARVQLSHNPSTQVLEG
jgi:hypothetical protein